LPTNKAHIGRIARDFLRIVNIRVMKPETDIIGLGILII
jgi:hypothetical protein